MRHVRIRAGFRVAAGIAALTLPLAAAGNAFANPPGDNGDVKIHVVGAPAAEPDNDPHVCKFYLDAFNFDSAQQVSWTIEGWAPTGHGEVDLSGAITLDANGDGHTGTLSLPDGHYKLDWTFVGEHGNGKHKVFWVECNVNRPGGSTGGTTIGGTVGGTIGGTVGGTTSTTSTKPGTASTTTTALSAGSTTPGSTSGGATGGSGSTGGNPAPTSSAPAAPAAPANGAPSTGKLAHTGADGSALIYAAIGAVVLAGGGYGLRRYASTRAKG